MKVGCFVFSFWKGWGCFQDQWFFNEGEVGLILRFFDVGGNSGILYYSFVSVREFD